MKLQHLLAAALLALAFQVAPAAAGVPFSDIPNKSTLVYVQLPDGTYAPLKADASGQMGGQPAALGFQAITSLSSATALTVPTGATWCIVRVELQAVRWRDDGTNPSASVGMPLAVGETLTYSGPLSAIKFIEQASGSKISISYYK